MKAADEISGYRYEDAGHTGAHNFLLPAIQRELAAFFAESKTRRVFDLGCGNGSVASVLATHGHEVAGVDPSKEGIEQARKAYPHLQLEIGSAYDNLVARFGRYPVVISVEVVEHVYAPRDYAGTLFDLVEPGGIAIVTTPYHGYLKNLALAASGRMDRHFTALWEHGHIKFWSMSTLGQLLRDAGFEPPRFQRVGRVPPLAKSMIAIARKPSL